MTAVRWIVPFVCVTAAVAQTPTPEPAAPSLIRNEGKPMSIVAKCGDASIEELGLTCTVDEPCPLFLELSDVQASGDRMVVAGNIHTGTVTLESVLLVSDDGGINWREAHPRMNMAVLDRIQFYDFESGWISGHILQPLPRDPFFLITSDGGKTWRRRPLSGESRPGAIEQYYFDSKTHGVLLITRSQDEDGIKYELWESMTGGDGWSVRQADSKPIPLNRPTPAPAGLRIRPEAASKSHRIERQVGASWQPIARFQTAAGACKPAPPTEAEPPPPPVEQAPAEQPKPPRSKQPAKPPSLQKR